MAQKSSQFSELISPSREQDIPALVSLVNSAYRGEQSRQGWTTEADLIEGDLRTDETSLSRLIQKDSAVILKYGEGDEISGCVFLEKQSGEIYLGMLTVSPDRQGSGIGKKLLEAATAYAIEKNCSAIRITVISARKELIEWYERHGYRATGETKAFPTDEKFGKPKMPIEFIVMKKKL